MDMCLKLMEGLRYLNSTHRIVKFKDRVFNKNNSIVTTLLILRNPKDCMIIKCCNSEVFVNLGTPYILACPALEKL